MKRFKLVTLVPSLCLMACSNASFTGVYEFRLGKTDGAHFGLSVELKEDAYEGVENMKQMTMIADLGDDLDIDDIDYSGDSEYFIDPKILIKAFIDLIPEEDRQNNQIKIDGYYNVMDIVNPKYGNRVKLGSDFIQNLIEKSYPEVAEVIDISKILTPERIELVACAYADKKQFTLQIPVSKEDLQQQLAWYGYFFDFDALKDFNLSRVFIELDPAKLPGEKDEARIGTHPAQVKDDKGNVVSSEVETMNKTFEYEFSRTYLYDLEYSPIGSFVAHKNDQNHRYLSFMPFDSTMDLSSIEGYIKDKESYKKVSFSVASNSKEVSGVSYTYPEDGEDTITFPEGTITFKDFLKKEFVFRDYHDVKVGLTKN